MEQVTGIMETEPLHEKLTKKFFRELPEGYFLMSNVFSDFGVSCFFEKISSDATRDDQWQRIKAAHADQRTCYVFKYRASCKRSLPAFMNEA